MSGEGRFCGSGGAQCNTRGRPGSVYNTRFCLHRPGPRMTVMRRFGAGYAAFTCADSTPSARSRGGFCRCEIQPTGCALWDTRSGPQQICVTCQLTQISGTFRSASLPPSGRIIAGMFAIRTQQYQRTKACLRAGLPIWLRTGLRPHFPCEPLTVQPPAGAVLHTASGS